MAESPAFIKTPFTFTSGLLLKTQTGVATSAPPSDGKAFTIGSNGGMIESILAVPLGSNSVTTLFIWAKEPDTSTYKYIGGKSISSTNSADTPTVINILPPILYPSSHQTTQYTGLRVDPDWEIYLALSATVTNGWYVFFNGGDF